MNFYKRFMGDYGRDTAHLSLAEHGAYTLLLDHYYSTETPLPADHVPLYRICRAFDEYEQAVVRTVADQFFPIGEDGMRHNHRADVQIEDDRERIDKAKLNGKKGGRPKKKNQSETQSEPSGNPAGFENETGLEPSGNPAHNLNETQQKPKAKPRHSQTLSVEPKGSFERDSAHSREAEAMTSAPATFTATMAHRGLAGNLNLDIGNEIGMFLANAKSKGKLSADWNAEFEMWLRRSRNFGNGKDQQTAGRGGAFDAREDARRSAALTIGVGSQYAPAPQYETEPAYLENDGGQLL